jgi:F-type H+-transporting ATPase subunit gamma
MSSIRVLRRRIRSVQSTQQITKAMEMVAASKLRRAQKAAESARPYGAAMAAILEQLAAASAVRDHPLFAVREKGPILLVVNSADRGLCGSFNTNIIRHAAEFLRARSGEEVELLLLGKKAVEYFRRRHWRIAGVHRDFGGKLDLARAQEITDDLIRRFTAGEARAVHILTTRFVTTLVRRVVVEQFLPIVAAPAAAEGEAAAVEYIFEPSPAEIYATLLPRYALTRVMAAMLESFASEHSARMVAMGSASTNAEEMIADLTLLRNRIRQAAITKEISELVGGAEALR